MTPLQHVFLVFQAAGDRRLHPSTLPSHPLRMHRTDRIPTQALKTPRRPPGPMAKPVYELLFHGLSQEVPDFLLMLLVVLGWDSLQLNRLKATDAPQESLTLGDSSCSPFQGSPVPQVAPTASSRHCLPTSCSL